MIIQTLGEKLLMSHGLGMKSDSVASKVKKVALHALTGAKVLGGTVGVLGAIGAVSGFDRPVVQQVRQRGVFERAIRGR